MLSVFNKCVNKKFKDPGIKSEWCHKELNYTSKNLLMVSSLTLSINLSEGARLISMGKNLWFAA
jgi:hypothetical protein